MRQKWQRQGRDLGFGFQGMKSSQVEREEEREGRVNVRSRARHVRAEKKVGPGFFHFNLGSVRFPDQFFYSWASSIQFL